MVTCLSASFDCSSLEIPTVQRIVCHSIYRVVDKYKRASFGNSGLWSRNWDETICLEIIGAWASWHDIVAYSKVNGQLLCEKMPRTGRNLFQAMEKLGFFLHETGLIPRTKITLLGKCIWLR